LRYPSRLVRIPAPAIRAPFLLGFLRCALSSDWGGRGRGCSLNPVSGNRLAERARGLARSVASRPNRGARDSRALCSRFPPRRAVAGPWPPGVGAVPLTLSAGNRRARSAWTCKVCRVSTESRRPRFARRLFSLSSTVHCRGTGAAGWSLDRDQPNRASHRFLTRLCQENRIRFARRRFVLVLFPHGSTRRTHRVRRRSQKCRPPEV
jgi:hypothetical protein